jgi:hypothetical protein
MPTRVAIALCAALLTACATPYQRQGFRGGFDETQLAPNIYRVSFKGNGYTGSERARDFALLRCAELTLQSGYGYFAIVDSQAAVRTDSFTTPTRSYTTGSATAYGYGNTATAYGQSTTTTYGGQTYVVSSPSAVNTIVMVRDQNELPVMTYDARFLIESLSRKYEINPQ